MELLYKSVISEELKELEKSLLSSISSDIALATEISNYLLLSGGKRLRPALCILVSKALEYDGEDLIKLASSIELLHTATLIHDDVVDESLFRRGKESIHSKWDNAHGVLVGDFVYSKAFQLMASFKNPEIIRTLADSTNRISEGEVLQLSLKSQDLLEKDYFNIVDRKTAELFKAAVLTSGILASCESNILLCLKEFATSLGIAYQVQDDILDYFGDEELTGKKNGKDFQEGKFTLPVIMAMKSANSKDKSAMISLLQEGDLKKFPQMLDYLVEKNINSQIKETFTFYSTNCLKSLEILPESPYKEALKDIVINLDSRLT